MTTRKRQLLDEALHLLAKIQLNRRSASGLAAVTLLPRYEVDPVRLPLGWLVDGPSVSKSCLKLRGVAGSAVDCRTPQAEVVSVGESKEPWRVALLPCHATRAHDPKVASSNLAPATKITGPPRTFTVGLRASGGCRAADAVFDAFR